MDLCCRKYFIYGSVWSNVTCVACRCMRAHSQTPAYLNKHTNKCHLSWKSHIVGESLHHVFPVSSGCYVDCNLYLTKILCSYYDLLSSSFSLSEAQSDSRLSLLSQTCLLSATFLFGRTTIMAASPPPCPCAALKGFPSWRLSWWWGLSVYYWVFSSPNSFPQCGLPPPGRLTCSLARRHCFVGRKGHLDAHLFSSN